MAKPSIQHSVSLALVGKFAASLVVATFAFVSVVHPPNSEAYRVILAASIAIATMAIGFYVPFLRERALSTPDADRKSTATS